MRAVWLVLAAEFRGRWRSWLVLGLLIAVASGFVLAAVPAMSAARSRPGQLLRTE
jgi:hypothetical protein